MNSWERSRRPSKRLGQNFLKDSTISTRIVSSADLGRNDIVLEPGAGHGVITRLLEAKAGQVIAVEKDRALAEELRSRFSTSRTVKVVEGDVLKTELPSFNRVVGTPPYYISSRLILFLQRSGYSKAHLVFQKEFSDRLVAKPGTPDYGRLSVTAQRTMEIHSLLEISRDAFKPRPKVDSILISLEPRPVRSEVDARVFDELVRAIFTQRRRLVRSALLHFLRLKLGRDKARTVFSSIDVPDLRVFELSVEDLEELAMQLQGRLIASSQAA